MKIQGKITILVNQDRVDITVKDDKANTAFLEIELTPDQFVACLSRLAYVECELEVNGMDRVGKTHENKSFEFEIPESLKSRSKTDELRSFAQSQLSDGWIADNYFGSQNSFFEKDGKRYARCIIRRYV